MSKKRNQQWLRCLFMILTRIEKWKTTSILILKFILRWFWASVHQLFLSLTTISRHVTLIRVLWVNKQWVFIPLITKLEWILWHTYYTTLKNLLLELSQWSIYILKSYPQVVILSWQLLVTLDTTRKIQLWLINQPSIEVSSDQSFSGHILIAKVRMKSSRDLILRLHREWNMDLMINLTLMV